MGNILDKDPSMHHEITPLAKRTNDLMAEGFTASFVMDDDLLKSTETGEKFNPDQVKICKHYRFEGSSDPGDMTILYAVETSSGLRGTIVDAFGTYSDPDLGQFMKNVEEYANRNNPGQNQYSGKEHQIFDGVNNE
jgi:hypothetical protein